MIKKLHYIQEYGSSTTEKTCLASLKENYPDFEFLAWQPQSSPLRILYDHGGLFVGQNILSLSRILDSYFYKPFFTFSNTFDSKELSQSICYADKVNSPFLLELMEKGIEQALQQQINAQPFKPCFNEHNLILPDVNVYSKNQFGFITKPDNTYPDFNKTKPFFLDMNIKKHDSSLWHLHYLIINKDSNPTKVFSYCENFVKANLPNHFLLLVCNDLERDLASRMGEFLTYHLVYGDKGWNTLFVGNNTDSPALYQILIEYISSNFKVSCCEELS